MQKNLRIRGHDISGFPVPKALKKGRLSISKAAVLIMDTTKMTDEQKAVYEGLAVTQKEVYKRLSDVQKEVYGKYISVANVVKDAKDALINSRGEEGFTDKNYMKEPGIIAEASALIGVLLMVEAFYNNAVDEQGNINPAIKIVEDHIDFLSDIETIKDIQRKSLAQIYAWYEEEGFTARPLIKRGYEDIFNAEDEGAAYVDTLTYVLSATILTRWLDTQNKLVLDDETRTLNMKLLAVSIDLLLKAQHEDGRWGFRADAEAESSLYFTYSAGATLADFFDYILGEIAYTLYPDRDEAEQEAFVKEFKDDELVDEINKLLGTNDIEERVNNARLKIQDWLIDECLPRMPRIAQCEKLSPEIKKDYCEKVGMWEPDKETEYTRYYNLNYAYYLIDLMVIHSTDRRFAEMLRDVETEAGKERWNRFRASCEGLLDKQDYKYYFGTKGEVKINKNTSKLWTNLMAQTIHASRAQYMVASRTGTQFWSIAELKIRWNHSVLSDDCESVEIDKNNNPIQDPSIVPMALRANTNFSYYISKQSDMEVDRLFDDIRNEVATSDGSDTVANLWDGNNYNIQLTERSIEAVVDYYDYLNKFESELLFDALREGSKQVEKVEVPVKTAFETAVDDKIAEYLQSKDGQAMISKAIEARLADIKLPTASESAASPSGEPDIQSIIKFISLLNKKNGTKHNPDGNEFDRLMTVLETLYEKVMQCSIHKTIKNGIKGKNQDEIDDKAARASQSIFDQYKGLLVTMADNEYLNDEDNKLAFLYNELKDMKK